jgi:acetyl esterase/lipase
VTYTRQINSQRRSLLRRRVQAVVDWYGSTDLTRFDDEAGIANISLLIGGPKAENRAKVEAANPVNYVSPGDPPFLFMHGREDQLCPVEQSRLMFDTLDDAGVDAVSYELHDLGHVFTRGGAEDIESERVAIDLLTADSTPSQTLYEVSHADEDDSATPLVEGKPSSGPDVIEQFLDNTIA